MTVRAFAAAALGGLLAACATEFEGEKPSALYGQHIDAAVALYGPWAEQLTIEGKRYYLWRRKAVTEDGEQYCELRFEVTSRQQIARRLLQGYPAACDLFTARFVPTEGK